MRVFLFIVSCSLLSCASHHNLPVYGQVPSFELTAQDGRPFRSQLLAGHVWIADFIFTHCPGPCLRMSSQMRKVQSETARTPGIRLISFTVDPARDSPEVLARFAARYNADSHRWTFLTGPSVTLQSLSRDAFKLGDIDGSLNHSTRLILVDKQGQIRGIYGTQDSDPAGKVAADAIALEKENS